MQSTPESQPLAAAACNVPAERGRASGLLMAAVLLLSASGLMFELTLTRIFSATIWYHYAFVAISVALFGWGLGGFLVYVLRLSRMRCIRPVLMVLSLLPALLMPVFLGAILQFPFTPERLTFYFGMSLLPFLAGGAALSLIFETYGSDSNRLYFADLVGASLGVIAVPVVISLLGAETAILATALLPALAAVLVSLSTPERGPRNALTAITVLIAVLVAGVTAWNYRTGAFAIRDAPSKGLYQFLHASASSKVDSDRWNAYSRITSVYTPQEDNLARLFIDSDAWTNVLRWDGKAESLSGGRDWFRAFPYRVQPNPRVLVIGPGGGTDVALALAAGSPKVTGVEMNPLIIDCVRRYGEQAGNLYEHPSVELVMNEGRNYIERTPDRFDAIMLGFVDSWASVSSGGLSLTENYLYTREALEAYYEHLTEGGALVIVRWPMDVRRLVANSVALLRDRGMGIEEIGRHILAVSAHESKEYEQIETVFMLCRSPLDAGRVDQLLKGHDKAHVIWAPTRPSQEVYTKLFTGQISIEQYADSFPTLATPVKDDRPFYFAVDKPHGLPPYVMRLFKLPLYAVLGFAAFVIVAGHLLGFRAPGPRTIGYFGALGLGFIVCEIALMQRLILLLGHPLYTLVVILFTILLASGLGSLYARRFAPERIHAALGWIIGAVVVLVVTAAFALPPVVRAALPLELPVRIALAAAMVFPFGFLMGMPFPLGLRRLAGVPGAAPVSALWGINGVASVVGSISAVVVAVVGGFTWVFLAGAACYTLAWLTRPR